MDQQLRKKGRLLVGNDVALRQKIVALIHDGAEGGHSGISATTQRVGALFAWRGMKRDIRNYIRRCDVCQHNKAEQVASPGMLQPLPIPVRIWEEISMDFIDGLPVSGGFTTVWVVVDMLSKYAHFVPIKHPYTASTIAQLFVTHIYKLHGMPRVILSDRSPAFTSLFLERIVC